MQYVTQKLLNTRHLKTYVLLLQFLHPYFLTVTKACKQGYFTGKGTIPSLVAPDGKYRFKA